MGRQRYPAFAVSLHAEVGRRWPGQAIHTLVREGILPQAAYAWSRGDRAPTLPHLLQLYTDLSVAPQVLVDWLQALQADHVEWAIGVGVLLQDHIPRAQWPAALAHLCTLLNVQSARLPHGSPQATDAQKA